MKKACSLLAVAVVCAVLLAMPLLFTQVARATSEWHLALNDVTTYSGGMCPSSLTNPWDGEEDYLIGSFYDGSTSGALFRYSYNGGTNWVTPGSGSHFGDELFTGFYWFHNGNNYPYQIPTWSYGVTTFIINAYNVIGIPDFTCYTS